MTPSSDVRLVSIFYSSGPPFKRDLAGFGKVKNIFVTVVHKAL
jgi:hypothetical protein